MIVFFARQSTQPWKLHTPLFETRQLIQSLLQNPLPISFASTRPMSRNVSIPKKIERVRDHAFDNAMDVDKKTRKVLRFQDLILSQPNSIISISRLEALSRKFGFKQYEAGKFVLKFPHVFDIFEHPVQRILYCRLTQKALNQIEQEKEALVGQIPDGVIALRKLLMLSSNGFLPVEHVGVARRDLGLPDDFEYSVILKHPQFFRLFDAKDSDSTSKCVEVVDRDPELAVCAIERLREMEYREKGAREEDMRFSFIINFPPGFKLGKYYKIAVWKWQRTPYWSPYDDVRNYDMRSLEAKKRMEKRAVAMIHELLSLTVEKKITLERIAQFREPMNLPKKLKEFLLQHQGIFYVSTRGNQGKLHTIFLREAYRKGDLIAPNELYLARRMLSELILLSPRTVSLDRELVSYRRDEEDDEARSIRRGYAENEFDDSETEDSTRHKRLEEGSSLELDSDGCK